MKRVPNLIKKGNKALYLGPEYDKCYPHEVITLKDSSMYILGRHPEHGKKIIPEDKSLLRKIEELTKKDVDFRGIELGPRPNISRAHCLLYVAYNSIFALDLKSLIGVYLNGEKLKDITSLSTGDRLSIGSEVINFIWLPDYSKKKALLIGADDIGNLNGVKNDVFGLESLLTARGFEEKNIRKFIYDKEGIVGKYLPTRLAIVTELERLALMQDENSLSFISYSGHSTINGDISLPSNPNMNLQPSYFREISPQELHERIEDIPGYKILLIDSCYSGKIKQRFAGKPLKNTLVLCSSQPYQKSFEKNELGYFTRKFLQQASLKPVINPSYIVTNILMQKQDHTFFGDDIIF